MVHTGLAVEACGLTKWYGDTTALEAVDLDVGSGIVHGLLGLNGAGKTTLLSALFGLVLPDEGSLRLFGRTREEAGPQWLEGVAGFVESPTFYPYLSGLRNLQLLGGLDGAPATSVDSIEALLADCGLSEAAGRKVGGYSLGMRQRLGLAAALMRKPRLLILDEPTNGLDPAGVRDLREALRRLADRGVSVLLSSHDMANVEAVCDAVSVLHRGRVVFSGGLEEMRAAAPHPAYRLRTSDDAEAVAVARSRPDVSVHRLPRAGHDNGSASRTDVAGTAADGLVVVAGEAALDDYVLRLGRMGIAVRALHLDASALESFFFSLTGGPSTGAPPALREAS